VGDKLLIAEENVVEIYEIKRYIDSLKSKKASGSDRKPKYIRKLLI